MKFSIRIYSVNVTKSTENCGFGQFTEEIPNGKLHFLYRASGQTHNSDFFCYARLNSMKKEILTSISDLAF